MEGFVKHSFPGYRVVDPMDVFVRISMPVVVFEQPVPAGQQANVAVSVTAHGHPALIVVSNLEVLGNFQQQALPALNESVQARGLGSI